MMGGENVVNIERLKTALKAKNITIEQASECIGVNPATFYRRISRNGEKFTVADVEKLADLLKMDSRTMQGIFFDNRLAETQV